MARPIGSPLTKVTIKLHIPPDYVLVSNKHRYVFVDVITPIIRKVSMDEHGSKIIYNNYQQILSRDRYNLKTFFGLRAIDIDNPMLDDIAVSVQLEIVIGEGTDTCSRELWGRGNKQDRQDRQDKQSAQEAPNKRKRINKKSAP